MTKLVQGAKRALRPAQVAEKLGVSVPTIWRYARENPLFPRPSKLSERVTVFDEAEIEAWMAGAPPSTAETRNPLKPKPSSEIEAARHLLESNGYVVISKPAKVWSDC